MSGMNVPLCKTFSDENAVIHLVEAAGQKYDHVHIRPSPNPYIDLYNKESKEFFWNALYTEITGTLIPVNRPHLFEIIVLRQYRRWEILSHGQPLHKTWPASGIPLRELVTHLTEAFDWQSVTCVLISLILPIFMASLIYSITFKSTDSHCWTKMTHPIMTFTHFLMYRLCTLVAFICGDCNEHFSKFFLPLICWSRHTVTRHSILFVTIISLILSLMYTTYFYVHLVFDFMKNDKPVAYFDTLSDVLRFFTDHDVGNLTFVPAGASFQVRQNIFKLPLTDHDDHASYESMISREIIFLNRESYYQAVRSKNVIVNTDTYGCHLMELTDPLWRVKKYHCITSYAVNGYEVVFINKHTTSKREYKFLRRVTRGMVEGHLARRTNRYTAEIYHSESMAAHSFESHEATVLDVIKLSSIRHLFGYFDPAGHHHCSCHVPAVILF